jgi:putative acetyltransferase
MEKVETLIRPEEPHDFADVQEILRLAFGRESEAALVEKLRRTRDFIPGLSLVAVREGRVVGHILFCLVQIRRPDQASAAVPALALAPLAVHPEFHNQGIGAMLVNEGLKRCRQHGHSLVIVVGPHRYYGRFGFAPARPKGLEAPFPVPDDAFLVAELVPKALHATKGTVRYPPAFKDVG